MARLKAEQRREQLIRVATKLFARYGYGRTTTAAIARDAGVTEPILYRHFKGKQDLYIAILRRMSGQLTEHWIRTTQGITDPQEKMKALARAFPTHLGKLEDAYRVLHGALAVSRDKQVLAVLREHYEVVIQFFQQLITDGKESGIFKKDLNASLAAWQIVYMGIGYAMVMLNLPNASHYAIDVGVETLFGGYRS